MRKSWWEGLDLRVLRHVRGVLHRRGLALTLVERRPTGPYAFAPLAPDDRSGAGLAVNAPELTPPELALIESMLAEAALDAALAIHDRDGPRNKTAGRRHKIIGGAPVMRDLYALLDRVAPSESTVLIEGENGTGKELVARAIHDGSERCERKFVVVNCSAFNDNLLDSEMFGFKRGAFTGAVADRPGLFELADSGTLFLDEIGDMSPALQVKVLRVIQEGTFNRVGDSETRNVDVRIIAATNRDLSHLVATGEFREDLFYRLNVINMTLPALRERRDDIPVLSDFFLSKARQRQRGAVKQLEPACAARLLAYPWPGNVRELENEIERLIVLAGAATTIGAELLSPRIRQWVPDDAALEADTDSLPAAVEFLERRMIGAAMRRHNGNKTRAAEELKVSRRNLIRLVQKYQLE